MRTDEFLNPVTRALLFPPWESTQMLREIRPPAPPRGGAAAHLNAARGDLALLLRPQQRPGNFAPIAIQREAGRFDVLRMVWSVPSGQRLTMAQTRFVVAIWADAVAPDGAGADTASAAARTLLDLPENYRLVQWGKAEGPPRSYGGRDPAADGYVDPDWPHWQDKLRWWSGEGRLAFITLKASGGPTREPITFDPESNARWF